MSRLSSALRPVYLLPIGIVIVYLAFMTRTYYWDGVLFAWNIERVQQGQAPAVSLFHPNHLLYSPLGYVLYTAALACGIHTRAITVLQISNVFFSAAAGYLICILAKQLTESAEVATFCWLLFAAGATWWKFSTDADSYILCISLLLLAALFIFEDQPRIVLCGICHIAAMLFHELAIFFYVPVLLAISSYVSWSRKGRIVIAGAYGAASMLIVSIVYLLCYTKADHSAYPTLWRWIASYDRNSRFTSSLGQITNSYLIGYIRLFVGGRWTFIQHFFSILMCAAFALSLAALFWAVMLWPRPRAAAPARVSRRATVLLWSWFLAYSLFLASWDPGSTFHKLFIWPAAVLLIGVYVVRSPALRQRPSAYIAVAAAIATWNFGAFIYPHAQASADPVYHLAQQINVELPKHATIYYKAFDTDDWYLAYFAPGRNWQPLPEHVPGILGTGILRAPICFETTALDALRLQMQSGLKWSLVNTHHNVRLECASTVE
ncbi:MAG: hypothetical protein JO091_00160 [Acidobacteriaceae bacterium]|nr:hypothetical protein [Acidobacteriaceae bacterium]